MGANLCRFNFGSPDAIIGRKGKRGSKLDRTDTTQETQLVTIYDKQGTAKLWLIPHEGRFVDADSNSIGYLEADGACYDYKGKHRGWFYDGIMRDTHGEPTGFTENPTGPAPSLPVTRGASAPFARSIAPGKPRNGYSSMRPRESRKWSLLDPVGMFTHSEY